MSWFIYSIIVDENFNFLIELISSYPWLIDTNLRNAYLLYYSNLAYSYGFGYIYAEALFNKYLEDNNKTSSKVKDTLNGNIKMDELFNYYKIGINQPTITTAKQKVKTVTLNTIVIGFKMVVNTILVKLLMM